jgi:hypothetical protein
MSLSRSLVTTEPKRIELNMDSDPRFAAAVGGAVRILAESLGMPDEMCREFQETAIRACKQAFVTEPARSHKIEFLLFADRMDVTVDSDAGSSAIRISRSVVPQH